MGMPRRWLAAAALFLLAVSTALGGLDIDSSARPIVALAFFFFVPGFALAGLLGDRDGLRVLTMSIGVSVAAGLLAAQVLLAFDLYTPWRVHYLLAFLSLPLLARQLLSSGVPSGDGT